MRESEKLAIAAHLHVLLRRKSGRVTDTEWMATNAEYAAEVVRFAHAKAHEDGHADLAEWADKLAAAMEGLPIEDAKRLGQRAAKPGTQPGLLSSGLSRYIRGLR